MYFKKYNIYISNLFLLHIYLGHHPGRPTEEEALSLPSRNGQDYLLLDQKKSTVRIVAEFVQPITQPVNVTVTWFGVSSPEESDWIAVYCPFDSKPEAYFDYLELGTGNPDGKPYPYGAYFPFDLSGAASWKHGRGSVSLLLPNIRCAYVRLLIDDSSTSFFVKLGSVASYLICADVRTLR